MLQPLFDRPVRSVEYLAPGHSDHASDVWRVRTDVENVVVRASRAIRLEGPFALGCHRLFGADPRRVWDLEALNAMLAELSPVPAPRVLRRGWLGRRPCVVVECIPGRTVDTFIGAPGGVLCDLGRALAHIHRRSRAGYGDGAGRVRRPLKAFHPHVAETIAALATASHVERPPFWSAVVDRARALPPPAAGCLVMPDLDPTQFLQLEGRLTGLVDTEFFCVGPRELDFVALEYLLDGAGAGVFRRAYAQVLPPPTLGPVREVYRLLYRLLEVQGRVPLRRWMAQPALFE